MKRPFVALNVAMSADGKITSGQREPQTFVSRTDRRRMDLLRADFDAVLIGAGTLRQDNPPLQLRDPVAKQKRAQAGLRPGIATVVLSASLNLPFEGRFFASGQAPWVVLASGEAAPWHKVPALSPHVQCWRLGATHVDMAHLLTKLYQFGIKRLLIEAAGGIAWQLIEQRLLDAWHLTLAPTLLGGAEAPTPVEGVGLALAARQRLQLLSCEPIGDEIFCHYRVLPR